jgi:ribonuclease J
MTVAPDVPAGKIFVDGYGVGDVGSAVIRERKRLAEDGLMIISAVIEKETGMLVSGPDIVSRGFVYVRDSEQLIAEVKLVAQIVIDECIHEGRIEWNAIRNRMRDDISRLLYDRTKRSPMVLPIITSV